MEPSLSVGSVKLVVQSPIHVGLVEPPAETVHLVRVPGEPFSLNISPDVILVDQIYPVRQLSNTNQAVPVRVNFTDQQPQSPLGLLGVEPGELLRLVDEEVLGPVRVDGVDLVPVLEGGHVHHAGQAEGWQEEQGESPHGSVSVLTDISQNCHDGVIFSGLLSLSLSVPVINTNHQHNTLIIAFNNEQFS